MDEVKGLKITQNWFKLVQSWFKFRTSKVCGILFFFLGVGGSTIVVIEFVGVGNSDSSGSGVSGDDDSSRPPAELEYAEDDVLIRCGRLGASFA